MRVALVVLVACGTPARPPPNHTDPPPAARDAAVLPADGLAPVVHRGAPRKAVEAPHAGAIQELAITSDASAAITSDELGGLRLWPKLDGTVEPRVVELARARVLAIGRRAADRFAVAAIDEVGGLEIAILDGAGATLQRSSQFADLAFLDVVMTRHGPLAVRSDQAILQLDDDGAVLARLDGEPGQRLVGLALAGDRPFALVEKHAIEPAPDVDAGVGRARPVEQFARFVDATGPALRWGEWIDAGVPLGPMTALSPTGKRLATLVVEPPRLQQHVVVIDLATKQLLLDQVNPAASRLAFADDDHLALGQGVTVAWLDIAHATAPATPPASFEPAPPRHTAHLEAAAGTVIASRNGELVIATPAQSSYLGYQLQAPHVVAAAPHGQLVIGVGETFSQLDDKLAEVGQPELVAHGESIAQLRWLAGSEWLVESARPDGTSLALVDLATHTTTVQRTKLPVVHTLAYEPSTRLVTLSYGDAPEIDRYDPEHHRLDRVFAFPPPKTFEQRQLVPTRPALAGGVQLVYVQLRDKLALRWVRDPSQVNQAPLVEPEGSLAGVDGAGHAFVWQNRRGALALVVFQDGKEIGEVATEGSVVVSPDPKGAQLLELAARSVALAGLDGAKRWALPVDGTAEALWLDDGAIVLVGSGGLARIDAATGAVTAARCGWRFGLATRPHPATARIEPVCAQLLGR